MRHIIEVKDLSKVYGNQQALASVSMQVKEGEIFGFLGPSGAGKTTMIKILTGQVTQTSGTVKIFQEDVSILKQADARKKFGVLTDNSGLYEKLSIEDNLRFYCDLYDVAREKIDDMLHIVRLHSEKKKAVSQLSKGMRQRVVLARALLHEPSLLFLDEPTSALDPVSTQYIYEGLQALNKKGTTIFLTTHDMYEADLLCDRIAFLHEGEIKLLDTPKNLKQEFAKDEIIVELHNGEQLTLIKGKEDAETLYHLMQKNHIATIHSNEPTIGDIFVHVTGRNLV